MSGPRATAIVNPRSANGTTARDWPELARLLEAKGHPVDVSFTAKPGQATELTRNALRSGATRIVAVGGDGTVNEVVNGFFDDEKAVAPGSELGVLCRGTGCDFIKTLDIPKIDAVGVERLLTGTPRPIDIGRARFVSLDGEDVMRYFINIAEAGIGGEVATKVNHSSKAAGGFLTFLGATLGTFLGHSNHPAEVIIDGKYVRSLPLCNVVIANGRYFGGGMKIIPHADLSDGKLDVLVMGDFNAAELFANVAKVYQGTHLGHPKVELFVAESIRITSAVRLPLDLDGESPGTTPAEFDVVPRAINLIS